MMWLWTCYGKLNAPGNLLEVEDAHCEGSQGYTCYLYQQQQQQQQH